MTGPCTAGFVFLEGKTLESKDFFYFLQLVTNQIRNPLKQIHSSTQNVTEAHTSGTVDTKLT